VNPRARAILAVAALAAVAAIYLWGMHTVPQVGHYRGPYGYLINAVGVTERHATNLVSAVNFDYRGFDTIGEEYVLFIAVTGVALVLRRAPGEEEHVGGGVSDQAQQRRLPPTSDAVRLACLFLIGPTLLLGIYVVAHGQLTPGGGFQGGVILATALLLLYLAGRYRMMKRYGPVSMAEMVDATGAGGFVLVGVAALAFGGVFLVNVLPLGTIGYLPSAGTITIISALIGLEVFGGMLVLVSEFLEQALEVRSGHAGP
jgi:multicomponent Na+:H+ antiporter subunit B